MKLFLFFLKTLINQIIINIHAKKLGYYTSIHDIPIYNWDQIEQGNIQFLFKNKQGRVPVFFNTIISNMFFEFEKINVDIIRKKHQAAYLLSLFVTKKNVKYLNKYNELVNEITKIEKKKVKKQTLNDKVNYIEETFNQISTIDIKTISTSRFYSLFYRAIEKNEQLRKKLDGGHK